MKHSGFTLIELITIIVLLGIIGVSAIGRLGNTNGIEEQGYVKELVSAIRYAQKQAVAINCVTQIDIDGSGFNLTSTNDLAVCTSGATFGTDILNPSNGQAYSISMPTSLTLSASQTIIFFANGSADGSNLNFTLMGEDTDCIRLVSATGYTHSTSGAC